MAVSSTDAEVDKLYQLPLEEFTGARNALAKESGNSDIRSLQKPPIAAWTVNQVYWKRRPVYEALIEAATTLRAAHTAVLSGKRADLRAAGKEHEEAIEEALKTAVAILQEAGHPATDATRQAIATTLRGLPSQEPPGRLTRTLQPGGFEALAGIPVRGAPAAARSKPAAAPARDTSTREPERQKTSSADANALAKAREAAVVAARELKLAEHAVRREEFEAARAARDAERAQRDVESAREQVEAAERALQQAEREAADARRAREAAERRARDADGAVTKARDAVREAEGEVEKLTKRSR